MSYLYFVLFDSIQPKHNDAEYIESNDVLEFSHKLGKTAIDEVTNLIEIDEDYQNVFIKNISLINNNYKLHVNNC